jgi:hypothetical protein
MTFSSAEKWLHEQPLAPPRQIGRDPQTQTAYRVPYSAVTVARLAAAFVIAPEPTPSPGVKKEWSSILADIQKAIPEQAYGT